MRMMVLWCLGVAAAGCGDSSAGREDGPRPSAASSQADSPNPSGTPPPASGSAHIVFLGTSLTAGYGLDDPDSAYPALVQERIADAGLAYRVVNAGVSGDTSAGGLARLPWLLEDPLAVLVLELGANDGLRGQSPEALRRNLTAVIDQARGAHPDLTIVLAGMEAPPNLGPEYTAAFRDVFPSLAEQERTSLIPFLLDGVAGVREVNQADGIHPNVEGHSMVADNVWAVLEDVLLARCRQDQACPKG